MLGQAQTQNATQKESLHSNQNDRPTQGRPRRNARSAYATSPEPQEAKSDAQGEPSAWGRPRRSARGAGANAPEPQDGQDAEVAATDQPTGEGHQANPNPTPEQLLQQLQAGLQRAQQERDRLAVAFEANQRAMQMSQQASEVRQQLAILQAEIQSLQTNQPLSNNSNQIQPAPQSQINPWSSPVIQPTFGTPHNLQPIQRSIDPKSPLSEGLQSSPWPLSYKPITLPKFNGKKDPRQFVTSFEAAIASAGGNDTVLAKSFVIAAEGDALAWYSMLRPTLPESGIALAA